MTFAYRLAALALAGGLAAAGVFGARARRESACVAEGAEVLCRIEAEHADVSQRADFTITVGRSMSLRTVFDDS